MLMRVLINLARAQIVHMYHVQIKSLFKRVSLLNPLIDLQMGKNCTVVFTTHFLLCKLMHFILT